MRAYTILLRNSSAMSRSGLVIARTMSTGGGGGGASGPSQDVAEMLKSRIDDIPMMESEELSKFISQLMEQPTDTKSQIASALTEAHSKRREAAKYLDVMVGAGALGVYFATPIPFWLAAGGGGGAWYFLNESSKESMKKYSLVQTQLIKSLSGKQ